MLRRASLHGAWEVLAFFLTIFGDLVNLRGLKHAPAQCSKGRTELKINVLLFGSNDIFCSLNELLHWKKQNIYDFIASNQDFL